MCTFLLCTAASGAGAAPLDEYASAWAEQYDVSGSWRLQRGKEVLAEGGRNPSRAGGPAFTGETRFWIGSNSKQFAAAAVLRLVEQGKVELAAPLTQYLPQLKAEALTRGGTTCSVEHVLAHRCGLVRETGGRASGHLWDAVAEAELFRLVNEGELSFVPGSSQLYSNVGYALIGLLVQRVSGQGYEGFLREQLWDPLGMTHTGIRPPQGMLLAPGQLGVVVGWVDTERWLPLNLDEALASAGAAGNLYSSVRDLAIWTHAVHRGKVLSPASYAELTRPRGDGYALGLGVDDSPIGKQIWHNGSLIPYGLSSWLAYLPDQDLMAVVLANRPIEAGRAAALVDALLRKASGQPEAPPAESSLQLRLKASKLMLLGLLLVAPPALVGLWMLVRRVRRPELLDRQNWWLSYHIYAVLLGESIPASLALLLVLWAGLVLAGLHRSRFWQLPGWQSGPSRAPRRGLVLRSLLLLGLLLASALSPEWWLFPLAFVGLLLAELCLWLATRHKGADTPAVATAP